MMVRSLVLIIVVSLQSTRVGAQNVIVDSGSSGRQLFGRFVETSTYRAHGKGALISVPGNASAYRFTVRVPRDGFYRLYAWWPESDSLSPAARYSVRHRLGKSTIFEDQRERSGQWNLLGSFLFDSRTTAYVDIASPDGNRVAVDALRIAYAGTKRPTFRVETDVFPVVGIGEPLSEKLEASGGTPPYRWYGFGSIPLGVRVDETGVMIGSSVEDGRFDLQLLVEDGDGDIATRTVPLDILERGDDRSDPNYVSAGADTLAVSDIGPAEGDLTELRVLVESLEDGNWAHVNENFFYEVWTPPELRPLKGARTNPPPFRIVRAWASFAWDTRRGDLIIYGGGHGNYTGNDVYRWRGASRMWERASLPSEITQDDLGNVIAIDRVDAAPASAHTYDNSVYLRVADRYMTYGGATPNGGPYVRQVDATTDRRTGPYLFDPSRADGNKVGGTTGSHVQRDAPHPEIVGGNMWENRDIYANVAGNPTLPRNFINGVTAYTQEGGKDVVFVNAKLGGSARHVFKHTIHDPADPTRDTWEHVGGYHGGFSGKGSGAYDPELNIFVRTAETIFTYWDLNTAGPRNPNIVFTPEDPSGEFFLDGMYGMDYDPVRGQFALWNGYGTIWMLIPPPAISPVGWRVEKQPVPTSGTPGGSVGRGVLGKWKYVPNLDVFLGLEDPIEGNIWIYKPVGWTPPGNVRPLVRLTSPSGGSVFFPTEDITLAADASDPDGNVERVEFFEGNFKLGEDASAPYEFQWTNVPKGSYVLTAVAIDDAGTATTSAAVDVLVSAGGLTPSVTITTPAKASVFAAGSDVHIEADASDPDGNVALVEFFQGDDKLGEDSSAPFDFDWKEVPAGNYILSAVAVDDGGGATASESVKISVLDAGGNTVVVQDGLDGYIGTIDTYLDSSKTQTSLGTSTSLRDKAEKLTTLVRFAIFQSEGGPVPDGVLIESAILSLYKFSSYNHSYEAHRVLRDWSEDEATWSLARSGEPWSLPGAAALGADIAPDPEAEGAVDWAAGWLDLDVTNGVRDWGQGGPNYGWRIVPVAGNNNIKRFHSREEPTHTDLRPRLTIVFSLN